MALFIFFLINISILLFWDYVLSQPKIDPAAEAKAKEEARFKSWADHPNWHK